MAEDLSPPGTKKVNPPWSREELVLALDLYVKHGGADPGPNHPEVIALSHILQTVASESGLDTFRNPKGVAMKLMNFRSLDPVFTSKGGVGLTKRGKGDGAVWAEFEGKPTDLSIEAELIRSGAVASLDDEKLDDLLSYSAKEGLVSFRLHKVLERDAKVVAIRKASVLNATGKLACEGCGFDFATTYGPRGYGFIEAHHTNPVHAMVEGDVTTPEDLALLCSNCHRMIHKAKPWLTVAALKELVAVNAAA